MFTSEGGGAGVAAGGVSPPGIAARMAESRGADEVSGADEPERTPGERNLGDDIERKGTDSAGLVGAAKRELGAADDWPIAAPDIGPDVAPDIGTGIGEASVAGGIGVVPRPGNPSGRVGSGGEMIGTDRDGGAVFGGTVLGATVLDGAAGSSTRGA